MLSSVFGGDPKVATAILIPPLMLLAFLRNFKYLAWTSVMGDIAVVFGATAVIAYGLDEYGVTPMSKLSKFNPSTYG
jgi:hypothetical protein